MLLNGGNWLTFVEVVSHAENEVWTRSVCNCCHERCNCRLVLSAVTAPISNLHSICKFVCNPCWVSWDTKGSNLLVWADLQLAWQSLMLSLFFPFQYLNAYALKS